MTQNEFIGSLFLALVPVTSSIVMFAKIAWNLSGSITRLDETLKTVQDVYKTQSKKIEEHDDKLHEHELELYGLATKLENHLH